MGRYRIEKLLGRGGMGEVFLASDTLLNRRVALKRLLASGADHAQLRASIVKEARRASQINDRHIATIHDVLDLDDQVVLVMEYVDGVTLRERMTESLSLDSFYDLATQCVEAMAVAHAHGVIHRDLKPENLMVTRDGTVKILDFGIAKRSATAAGATSATTETLSGGISGTPQYMAPEAHLGGVVDGRTDMFAMGAVFYELLTSHRAFDGPIYGAVLHQVLNITPTPVAELNPAISPGLSDVVARMLAKDPAERFATPAELMEHLERARRGDGAAAVRVPAAVRVSAADVTRTDPLAAPAPAVRNASAPARSIATFAAAIGVAVAIAVAWRMLAAPALPKEMNVALLPPTTAGDTAYFALGALGLVSERLRRHSDAPGFQMATFADAVAEKIHSPAEARKILGVNLALVPTIEQTTDTYRARLDLIETAHGRRLSSQTIQVAAAQPFVFLDRVYETAVAMLRLAPRRAIEPGVRGAGTLRFYLQGLGRLRAAGPGDAQRAIADFEIGCNMEPESAAMRAGLGLAQFHASLASRDSALLKQAESSARQALALDSTRIEPHRALAWVAAGEKNHVEALKEFARGHELDPTDDELNYRLARTFDRLGQPEREEAVFIAAIAARPHCWKPYWWHAAWLFHHGKFDDSMTAFREMIGHAPDYFEGYSSLGGLLVQRGEYAHAIDTLKLALALRPTKGAFDNLGTAYFNSGRFQEAVGAYNQSFQFGDADYVTWFNLAEAYSWLQDRKAAAAGAYAQAVRLGRDEIATRAKTGHAPNVMIPADLANIFARLGQPDSARVYIARAVSADSTNPNVAYCAALTYWQLGERDKAIAWLQKSVHGGYPTAWLRDSPVFVEWRTIPEFRALVGAATPGPQHAAIRS